MKLSLDDLRLLGELPRPCSLMRGEKFKLEGGIARASGDRLLVFGKTGWPHELPILGVGEDWVFRSDLFYGRELFRAKLLDVGGERDGSLWNIRIELGVPDESAPARPSGPWSVDRITITSSADGLLEFALMKSGSAFLWARHLIHLFPATPETILFPDSILFGSPEEIKLGIVDSIAPASFEIEIPLNVDGRRVWLLRESITSARPARPGRNLYAWGQRRFIA